MEKIEILHALASGVKVGELIWERQSNRLSFKYASDWIQDPLSFPLSLSMPLAGKEFGPKFAEPFIVGLLPDNAVVLDEWAKRFKVSAGNPFKLLMHVGEDCAGGVQFVLEDRIESCVSGGSVDWLNAEDLSERIAALMANHGATRSDGYEGQFSLAGAQPKTAFLWSDEKQQWGVPSGSIPTTHIFKPCGPDLEGHAENEHFCLTLARKMGFSAVESRVLTIGEHAVIVVKRYDRIVQGEKVLRIHQEDMCQSLGVKPQWKYQSEGGPSPSEIIAHIEANSSKPQLDKDRFVDALIYNCLIGGTDAHAKNYSLLIAGGGQVRLAPLYDIASIFPYAKLYVPKKTKLAMKVGGQYKLSKIGKEAWKKASVEWQMKETDLIDRIVDIGERLISTAPEVTDNLADEGLDHPMIGKISEEISGYVANEMRLLK